jgi:hypothetical protein
MDYARKAHPQEVNRLFHNLLKKVSYDTMRYSAANNSLCKDIAETHWARFGSIE